jgi:glycosyltransferase involved in cell wall biosynthesis
LPDNYILIFPFTYRFDANYYYYIKNILEKNDLKYKFFLEFMSQEDVARLRIITNVHINFVTSDGLNASMLESLYANSVVIAGSWLNYDTLDVKSIFYVQADIGSLFLQLQNIFTNYPHYFNLAAKNKEIVYNYFSWRNAIKHWIGLYNKIAIG